MKMIKKNNDDGLVTRRQVLRNSLGFIGAGMALQAVSTSAAMYDSPASSKHESVIEMKFEPRDLVRVGIIGVGGRGGSMVPNFLAMNKVQVNAICDIDKAKAVSAQKLVEKSGQKSPAIYVNGEHDFENLCKRDDLDFIYIATPWDWHVPMALCAMKEGKHAGVEVPAATTIEDCWKLVDTSEATRRHCMIMENACYGYNELLVLNMVRAGLFGDLLHGEAAYIHDLRRELFSEEGEGLWRRLPHTRRNGNLYPTHGLGPMANYMNVNRGDRFDYLVSMSSPHKGLEGYRANHIPAGNEKWKEQYVCGDMNTSLIKTANGLSIMLQHDVSNAHPYTRINTIVGSKGAFRDFPEGIYFDGQSPHDEFDGKEKYQGIKQYKDKYSHDLWKRHRKEAEARGHGGMDYLMIYRLMQCMHEGLTPDIDVYDAASWSAPGPLSETSVSEGSTPVKFPDFTRGKWKQRNGMAM
jgi:hypothetical protein